MSTVRHATRLAAVLLASAALLAACDDDPASPAAEQFTTLLTGAAERPTPVTTNAGGTAKVTVQGDQLDFEVNVVGIDSVTMAHIHVGGPEVAGSIVLDLFTGPTTGTNFTGRLARGSMFRSTLTSRGVSFDSVTTLLRNGNAYVNVHTRRNGAGEIRGQLATQ